MTTKQQQFIKATLEFISLNNAEIQHHTMSSRGVLV